MRVPTRPVAARMSAVVVALALPAALVASGPLDGSSAATLPAAAHPAGAEGSGTDANGDLPAGTAPPQHVAPRATIAGTLDLSTKALRDRKISVTSSKGSKTWTASALAGHDLPSAAMRAYKTAARTIDGELPGCHLPWTLLAGIGRVESNHGRYGGSVLGADGVPRPAIVGIALNGAGPVAAISDSDGGRFDGDTVWDRAVGPMQFIPTTWRTAGRDGDGDGVKSPNDIDDAALAAAAYLCHGSRDLSTPAGTRAAVLSYNNSGYYVDLVSAFAAGYRTGAFSIPSPPVADGAGDGVVHLRAEQDATGTTAAATKAAQKAAKARKARRADAAKKAAAKASKKAASATHSKPAKPTKPKPAPTKPKPSPKPKPKPTPPPAPKTSTVVGAVEKTGTGWKVGGVSFTPVSLAGVAVADWDGDGETGSVSDELDGMATGGRSAKVSYVTVPALKVTGLVPA